MRVVLPLLFLSLSISTSANATSMAAAQWQLGPATTSELIAQYQADRDAIGRLWSFPLSAHGAER